MKYQPDLFSEEIVLPDIVQQKADEAFALIQKEGTIMAKKKQRRKKTIFKSQAAAIACICLIAAGSVTAFAAIRHFWSRGMQGAVQATPEQQQTLTDQGVAEVLSETPDYTALSVTDNNITVTPETVIVDDNFAHISFSVKGFDPGENNEPAFETAAVYTGADPAAESGQLNVNSGFYNGIVADENAAPVYDDGTPVQFDENGALVSRYFDEDGTLEYVVSVSASDGQETLPGKTLHVDLRNLGTTSQADFSNMAEGSWSFDIELPSASSSVPVPLKKAVDGTVFTIDSVSLSPISIDIDFTVNGEVDLMEGENGIPLFSGVILKDGTRLPYIADMGILDYTDDTLRAAYQKRAFDWVIDPEQVASLLFMTEPETGLVEVPIG